MRASGIPGYFTNHSLHVTAATRPYDARVDEDTIMQRTGHRSSQGVRMYKRETGKLKELSFNVLNQMQDHKKVNLDNSNQSNGDESENRLLQIAKPFQLWTLVVLQTSPLTLTSTSNCYNWGEP